MTNKLHEVPETKAIELNEATGARLREIANEIKALDKKAIDNEDYQKASKLYCESTTIQMHMVAEYMAMIGDYKNMLNQANEQCEKITAFSQIMYCYLEEIGHAKKFKDYMNYELECAEAESIPN